MKKSTKALIAVSAVAASAAAFGFGAGYMLFNEVHNRNAKIFKAMANKAGPAMENAERKEDDERLVWFRNAEFKSYEMINSKNFRLKAKMIPAENDSKLYVFCSHGYRSTGDGEYSLMAKFYHDLGFNVFIVDHQAHGESDGKYIGFGYHEYKDCMEWLSWMIDKFGKDIQIVLQGVSMGCATVSLMSGDENLPENVKFTVADCGYTSAQAEFEHCIKNFVHLPKHPFIDTANEFNKLFNGYDFKDASPINAVSTAKVPMLFIHGDCDTFVPTYMVHQLYGACNSEYKDLLLVSGAAHAESYRMNSEVYEEKVKEFVDKFIEK